MTDGTGSWAVAEFGKAQLGDARLNRRLIRLADQLMDHPTASIAQACGGWSETQGAYRFFDQAREGKRGLGWQDVLAPHMGQTEARMRAHRVVLCLQDTTELDYNGERINGLGPLSYESQRGMHLHPTYAVSAQREPLGILDLWMWAREPKAPDGERPGVLESRRWIEGYERVAERAGTMPDTRLVYVADREADILALMRRAQVLGHPADWLIRAQHNRCLPEGGKLWTAALASDALGEIEFTLPARHNRPARTVRQAMYSRMVQIADGEGATLPVTCLIAQEIGAPAGVAPIEWRLLSNRTVNSLEDAAELIDYYRCRWEIETLFHVLKNGCKVEALQLGHVAKLELALAVYLVVAWRLAHMIRLARAHPDLPADELFAAEEWQGAYVSRSV